MCQPLWLHCTTCPWSAGYWDHTIQYKFTLLVCDMYIRTSSWTLLGRRVICLLACQVEKSLAWWNESSDALSDIWSLDTK